MEKNIFHSYPLKETASGAANKLKTWIPELTSERTGCLFSITYIVLTLWQWSDHSYGGIIKIIRIYFNRILVRKRCGILLSPPFLSSHSQK